LRLDFRVFEIIKLSLESSKILKSFVRMSILDAGVTSMKFSIGFL